MDSQGTNGNIGDVSEPWNAIYTRHQHEKLAATNLQRKGFEVFLPLYSTTHRWKDRNKKLSLPLFPCYVFLRGAHRRRIELLATPAVCKLVEIGGRMAIIPDEQVEAIRRTLKLQTQVEPWPYFRSGDRVRVNAGPLQGLEGVFVRARDGGGRLILSVELVRRSIAVEVDVSVIEPIQEHSRMVRCTDRVSGNA